MTQSTTQRALLISYLFPPIGGIGVQRSLKFARYLSDYGWQVSVLTTAEVYSATMDTTQLEEIPNNVDVTRIADPVSKWIGKAILSTPQATDPVVRGYVKHNSKSMFRFTRRLSRRMLKRLKNTFLVPDESVVWALRAVPIACKLVRSKRIDCIYTTSSPNSEHLTGWLIHLLTGVKWVADFRDPWTDNIHFQHEGLRGQFERWLEKKVFTRATAVTTVTDSFKSLFDSKYPAVRDRIHVIRNGVDPNDFPVPAECGYHSERFTIVYAGILYPRRSPAAFLQALGTLLKYGQISPDDIRVQFAGVFDYPGQHENQDLVQHLGLEKIVEVVGYLPHRDTLKKMQAADALLLIGDTSDQAHQYVPGKLYEYLYVRKPILALLPPGEAASLIDKARAGFIVNPQDKPAIQAEILRLVREHQQGHTFEPNIQETEKYTRQAQTAELATLMSKVTGISKTILK